MHRSKHKTSRQPPRGLVSRRVPCFAALKRVQPVSSRLLPRKWANPDSPADMVRSPGQSAGSGLLSTLFGGEQTSVTDAIASSSGLRTPAAASILSTAVRMVMGLVGSRVRERGLNASQFGAMVSQEGAAARGMLPAGFGNGSGPELVTAGSGGVADNPVADIPRTGPATRASIPWLWPVIVIALIVIGWVWFASGRKSSPIARIPPIEGGRSRSALGATENVVLPGNVNLQIPRGGMEDRLLNFIQIPRKLPQTGTIGSTLNRNHSNN